VAVFRLVAAGLELDLLHELEVQDLSLTAELDARRVDAIDEIRVLQTRGAVDGDRAVSTVGGVRTDTRIELDDVGWKTPESRFRPTVVDSASIPESAPVTVASAVAAGSISKLTDAVALRARGTVWVFPPKPDRLVATEYVPGGSRVSAKRPCPSVVALRTPCRLGLLASTATPGSGVPPVATTPRILPVV
jgi:hypothetical protein